MKIARQWLCSVRRQSVWAFSLQFGLIVILFLGLEAAQASPISAMIDRYAPQSPLATPAGRLTNKSSAPATAGTIPPQTLLSGTVALPLVFGELPHYFPLIVSLPSTNLPINPYPPYGAEGQSANVYLSWKLDNTTSDLPYYEVYLDANDDTPQTLIYQNSSPQMAFDPATFENDTQYYWRVVTVDARSVRVAGPVWTFRTEGVPTTPDVEAMVYVPAGEFRMGCEPSENPPAGCIPKHQDTPQHTVYLDAYEIDKYEVTNAQYRACSDAGVCSRPRRYNSVHRENYFYNTTYDNYPVLFVSWWDGQAYCEWKDKRLPTEAEWEKAARGPIDTRPWPWGWEFPDCSRMNFTDNRNHPDWVVCAGDTTQVGSYPAGASPYGVMDMAGNVFEWVGDLWDKKRNPTYYEISPYANPTGPDGGKETSDSPLFVMRGGSYRPNWYYTRSLHRHFGHHGDKVNGDAPLYRNDQVGFRCARPLAD